MFICLKNNTKNLFCQYLFIIFFHKITKNSQNLCEIGAFLLTTP